MRRIFWLLFTIFASPAFAHDHEHECLGHHWAMPEYPAEIHYQLIMILAAAAVIIAYKLITRTRRVN